MVHLMVLAVLIVTLRVKLANIYVVNQAKYGQIKGISCTPSNLRAELTHTYVLNQANYSTINDINCTPHYPVGKASTHLCTKSATYSTINGLTYTAYHLEGRASLNISTKSAKYSTHNRLSSRCSLNIFTFTLSPNVLMWQDYVPLVMDDGNVGVFMSLCSDQSMLSWSVPANHYSLNNKMSTDESVIIEKPFNSALMSMIIVHQFIAVFYQLLLDQDYAVKYTEPACVN